MLEHQHETSQPARQEALELQRASARAASFSERRLERAYLPADDYHRHFQQSTNWLDRLALRPEA
eukprot:14003797-Alexandrium_andersonii.AAC.1